MCFGYTIVAFNENNWTFFRDNIRITSVGVVTRQIAFSLTGNSTT